MNNKNQNNWLDGVTKKLEGTKEAEVLIQMNDVYARIFREQDNWYKKSGFTCVDGCGQCCHNFEPDLFECEAIYMAAWLLENQKEVAEKVAEGIFPFDNGKTCNFYNDGNPYHCSIYEGRPFICRLFGGSGFKSKNGEPVFKPCKFYPVEELKKKNSLLEHRQFSKEEINEIFGCEPPVMSDMMEITLSIIPDNYKTLPIRKILPEMIQRLKWIYSLKECSKK